MPAQIKEVLSSIYYVCATISCLFVVVKLFYGWFTGDQQSKSFIIDTAETHLPHIYRTLSRIEQKLEMHVSPAPSINFYHNRKRNNGHG